MNVHGNIRGLKPSQLKRLEHIYRRRIPKDELCSWELLKYICSLSRDIKRLLCVLADRRGSVEYVIVGDNRTIPYPEFDRSRTGIGRLRGLRCIHTSFKNERLSAEDKTHLSMLKLDCIACVSALEDGMPGPLCLAHLLPEIENGRSRINELCYKRFEEISFDFHEFITSLEYELQRSRPKTVARGADNAIIVTVAQKADELMEEAIAETKELALTSGVNIVDMFTQYRKEPDPKYLVGKGKLADLIVRAMELDANLLIFNQDLNPGLARRISDTTGLKILDRTQVILDVFAQRAKSGDGKLQVELAQLKYTLPRLIEKDTMMSRLTGGIGGRGPGETKLEINRRRAQERITRLERDIEDLGRKRSQKRQMRKRTSIPIVSIVGYTNAGKSTLLNNLTDSHVAVEDRPFSTLDPVSRRLRFPKEREVLITDTVGFIRDLPPDLINAFRATLEEIGDADLILHIVDVSNRNYRTHIESVEKILKDLEFHLVPRIIVANKIDKVETDHLKRILSLHDALPASALDNSTFGPLLKAMERMLWPTG